MTTWLKKMCSRVIFGCAVVCSTMAWAAPSFTYLSGGTKTTKSSWGSSAKDTAAGWEYKKTVGTDTLTLTGTGPYELSGDTSDLSVEVNASCTLTLNGYSCKESKSPIVVNNGATLTLLIGPGESKLDGYNSYAGINVQPGGKVVIDKVEGSTDAECVLKVYGGDDAAGIGANDESSCGEIEINGGTVAAKGGAEAAGIGGGNINSSGTFTIGSIVINGGNVTANGRDRGAGIGTGLVQKNCTVNAAGIYINGGTVIASENDGRAAAIGLGEVSNGTVTLDEIVITGGTVNASPNQDKNTGIVQQEAAAAGIGTGMSETGGKGVINTISISGGTVNATGARRGAGIGTGQAYLGTSEATVGSIEITGGTVTANGGQEAAGIGTGVAHGAAGNTKVNVNSITISGGTVVAKKGADTAGGDIGATTSTDSHSTGTATLGTVTVTGGSIAAGTTLTNPTNGTNNNLHSVTVPGGWEGGTVVSIVGLDGYGVEDMIADADGQVYPLLPDGTYVFNVNGRLFEVTVNGADATAAYAAATGMKIDGVDIAYGSGTGWFYDGDTLTIDPNAEVTVSDSSRLPVELMLGDGADVTLDGVTITGGAGIPAITSAADSEATLRLKGVNTLSGGDGAAAVQPGVGSTITILNGETDGLGRLTANGGAGAAGIGAGETTACGNVVIAGGRVDARGGSRAGTGAAGIGAGAGAGADCGTVTISGGTVTTRSGNDDDAQDVGNGAAGVCAGVTITGGSIVAKENKVSPQPTGLSGNVRAVTIHNDDWSDGTPVVVEGLPAGYGTNDFCSTSSKDVCVWLEDGSYPVKVNDEWYVATVDSSDTQALEATVIDVPSVIGAADLVYTGSAITGVPSGEGYTITGNVHTEPGHYTATVTPKAGYLWSDHTMDPVEIDWYIAPAVIADELGTIVYDDEQEAWVVTATNDLAGVLELPDNLGKVIFDLNGFDIVGGDAGEDNADGVNGGAAVRITHVDGGTGVSVSFVDGSGNGASIVGGDGADGTELNPAGGNGGAAIIIDDDAVSPSVTVGSGIAVIGGNGGAAYEGSGANGGNGGAGVLDNSGAGRGTPVDSTIVNNGAITGGNGGAGADSAEGNAGAGGNGGAGVAGDVDTTNGTVTGGNGGNGGSSTDGNGGDGGAGGVGVDGNVINDGSGFDGGDVGLNDGSVTGGNGGNGGDSVTGDAGNGGNGGAGVYGDVTDNNETITGGNGGNGGSSWTGDAGNGGNGGTGVNGTVEENDGTIAAGDNGTTGRTVPSIIDPSEGTIAYDDANDAWVVTLSDDVAGVVEIPDNLGAVVIDLNGHSVTGACGTAENPDGGAAIRIVDADGEGTVVSIVDNSEDKGSVTGGNGADGTAEHNAGGNGGAGIVADDGASYTLDVGEGVKVTGGNGGAAYEGSGANGGNGGAGVDGDVNENDGTIAGGNAGAGADSADSTGNGGNGGNGGAGVTGDVSENDGSITGGDAGNGGNGATPGNGGNGGAAADGTIADNADPAGTAAAGDNGTTGRTVPSIIDPSEGTIAYDDANDAWVVTLTDDAAGVVEIPDNLGAVVIDLNGHSVTGACGTAENPDGGAAIRIVDADGEGTVVSIVDNSEDKGSVTGGNGADGTAEHNAGGNGGPGIIADDGASYTLDVGEGVKVTGGNGGAAYEGSGANGGNGGAGVDGTVSKNDGVVSAGENGSDADSTPAVNPQGGAEWLDGSRLQVTAISEDNGNIRLTFTVPLEAGLDFADWVDRSVANHKIAVEIANGIPELRSANVKSLLNGAKASGVRVVLVGSEACSAFAAEYVSSEAATRSVSIRAPKTAGSNGYYRVYCLD